MKKNFKTFALILLFQNLIFSQNIKTTIEFGSKPFSTNPKTEKEFKFGAPIYGKLTTSNPLKNYAKALDDYEIKDYGVSGVYSHYISFCVCPSDEDMDRRTSYQIEIFLTKEQLENNTINFDVMPSEEEASSIFKNGFDSELAKNNLVEYDPETGNSVGKKREFDIYLFERETKLSEENGFKNGILINNTGVYISLGKLIVDYSAITDSRDIMAWVDGYKLIQENILEKIKK
jgi:hypothetical protein